ncbi:MAG TPA: disulfide bond formation protein B [Gammaproteobacteria bacterium]|nr:disulfide bond formation protein B [Gammaproteobacteria bacterium]
MRISNRQVFLGMWVVCAGLIAGALYLQHAQHLNPCPLCIVQRYGFIIIGLVALAAFIHNPGPFGARIYGVLLACISLAGAAVAIRHLWLIHHPEQALGCGPGLGYMLNNFSLSRALPMIFRGTGECALETWRLWGLTIPGWALVWFALLFVASAVVTVRPRPRRTV